MTQLNNKLPQATLRGHYQLIRKFFDDEIELDVKKGIEINVSSSIDWLKQSGEKGDVIAQRIIAEMYQNGLGVDKSPRTAYEWYLKLQKMNAQNHNVN